MMISYCNRFLDQNMFRNTVNSYHLMFFTGDDKICEICDMHHWMIWNVL